MNKFLNRKKPEQAVNTTPLVTDLSRNVTPSQLSPSLKKGSTKWKKAKRQPEPKPEFNLNNALPSADDFRTSLIMPNLSARFSMLREQDDPNSLLGKASDDSVLQPRRRSRMLDFSRGGLGDIAEVSSIRSSIRPPFAESGRGGSFISEDGYDSDPNSGGIMSRARPGEGNVLFGGRQKVYMIPKSGSSSTRNLGKAVYEDDIRTSAFQKHKQREREAAAARMADEARQFDFGLEQDEHYADDSRTAQVNDANQDLAHSPSLSSYEKKRSTNSSSLRSEARSSTAATSVASQPLVSPAPSAIPAGSMQSRPSLERANTKGRRLYEPGLDQHIYEQQSSALTRLNSIQRSKGALAGTRTASPYLHQTKSVGNLQDHSSQRSVYAVGAQSPPPDHRPAPLTSLGSFRRQDSNGGSPSTSGPASPLSPQNPLFDDASVLSQALEPGDRGKATAMGAFNKPQQAFDEKQYLERQMQLQRSTSSATLKREASSQTAFQQRIGRFEEIQESADRSRSRSKSKGNDGRNPAYQGSAAKNPNRSVTPSQLAQFSPQMNTQYSDAHRTFFGNIAASDSEDEEDDRSKNDASAGQNGNHYGKWQPSTLPSVSEHPALRNRRSNSQIVEEEEELYHEQAAHPRLQDVSAQDSNLDVDSPTLGGNLGGMISHLRSRSNASSMYPGDEMPSSDDVPEMPSDARHLRAYGASNGHLRGAIESEIRVDSTYSASNPWDLEEAANDRAYNRTRGSISPVDRESSVFGSRVPNRTAAQRDYQGQSQISQVSGISQESDAVSWQQELRKQNHQRDASSATQQERAAFDNELAARRAAIQDNIKSIVETERSNSPQTVSGPFKALGMLRTKSSRDSMDPKRDAKSFKAPSINGYSSSAASPTTGPNERAGYSFDLTRPRGESVSRPPMPNNAAHVRALHSEQDLTRREWSGAREGDARTTGRSPSSSNASQAGRSRSNSATTSGRSRSRTNPYRDDLEKAMMEGSGSSAAGLPDLTPFIPKELTPRPSPEILQSHFDGKNRSGSRSAAGYFEAKAHQPVQAPSSRGPSGSAVPQTLTSAVYNPTSARSSPAASPYVSQTATPPLSGPNTPLNAAFSSPLMTNGARPLRKKTISKSDISEPTLLSWTSNIDTVDLPPGASLKNGMAEPPPVPPINPKRKTRKIFGKSERSESVEESHETRGVRTKTPDPWVTFDNLAGTNGIPDPSRHPALRDHDSSPATSQYKFPASNATPSDRVPRQATTGADGAMF